MLALVLIGALIYQFDEHQSPCPLCELQRLCMIMVSLGPMLNLRYAVRPSHYAMSMLGIIFGGAVALRQIALHICPGFKQWGFPVFGLQLYTWSFLVFGCSLIALAFMWFWSKPEDSQIAQRLSGFEKGAMGLMFIVTLVNIVSAYMVCGLGHCAG
ncbi:MAG: hypothetical protein SP1CHLAM54_16850 [Chlamydiia bacterium]|nr:hypothetical protein [Chlamydiia bacterium]MCH9616574.1 hypothetical protein [Chlamydiia bacterium]